MSFLLSACSSTVYNIEYLTNPELVPYKDYSFILDAPFKVKVNDEIITVPKGFVTDLASTPRFLWPLYAPNDTKTIRPAILHDYMYRSTYKISRAQADSIFYYGLVNQGLTKWRARKYYYGVRLAGAAFFKRTLNKNDV